MHDDGPRAIPRAASCQRRIGAVAEVVEIGLTPSPLGKDIVSSSQINAGLARRKQRPEQHHRSFGGRQNRLGLYAPFELLVQPLDRIRRACGSPLAFR
jgi:hypothetical protein